MVEIVSHDQVYDQIQNGDIMYVANFDRWLPRIIQFVTKSSYSHVAICFWVEAPGGIKRLMVAEAQGGTPRRVQDFNFYRKRSLHIVAAPKDFITYATVALANIGEVKYSYIDALYVGIRDFFCKYLRIKLPKRDWPGEICSEYVARCLGMPSESLSPQGLYDQMGLPVKFIVKK